MADGQKTLNILIVEDDKVLSFLISKMVEKLNHRVGGIASTAKKAIELVNSIGPDLILMDIMLEDETDGIDTVLRLRKENNSTPVIFITGNSDAYNKKRAAETDYVDYLIKPININELEDSINKIL